jgi:NADH-quinone oxidoreductase subunit M
MLLVYTSIFTLPFLGCLSLLLGARGRFSFLRAGEFSFSSLATLIVFFGFAVKLPIYGLHYWLPIAHVEAPTFGSMILAGILLKLGGAGLLRLRVFIDISFLREVLLSYFLFSIIVRALVCCFQSDFKRLVAYSSVFHIITVPLLLVVGSQLREKAIVCVLVFHGLRSPILFMLVGVLYSMYSSRQLVLARGVLLASPFLAFILVASFFFTLSAPPYPSFYSEVIFLVRCYRLTPLTLVFFLPLVFLSLLYNLNWLVSLVFGSLSSSQVFMRSSLSLSSAIPLALSHVFSVGFLLLISRI